MRGRAGSAGLAAVALVGLAGVAGLALMAGSAPVEPDTGGVEPDDDKLEVGMVAGVVRPEGPGPRFKWSEFSRTSTNLPNEIPDAAKLRLQILHDKILAPLREHLGQAVVITSGYRSAAVNRAVGGSSSSRHMSGEAVDIRVNLTGDALDVERVAATIVKLIPPADRDQVIWYPRGNDPKTGKPTWWVHVGIRVAEGNRGEVLINRTSDGHHYPAIAPDPAKAV